MVYTHLHTHVKHTLMHTHTCKHPINKYLKEDFNFFSGGGASLCVSPQVAHASVAISIDSFICHTGLNGIFLWVVGYFFI